MATKLILHTFRMIFGNFGQALRISVGPYLILFAIGGALAYAVDFPIVVGETQLSEMALPNPRWALIPMVMFPLVLFVIGWVAVSWHRFILLEEYAGLLPPIKGRPIWRYVGKSILLALLLAVIAIPVFTVLSGLFAADVQSAVASGVSVSTGGVPDLPFAFQSRWLLINALVAIPFSYVALRWGIALVGTALGEPLGFFEAWGKSKSVAGVLVGVVLILFVINGLPQFVSLALRDLPFVQLLIDLAMGWLTMMLGISILTTLYGHVIEGRPLVD